VKGVLTAVSVQSVCLWSILCLCQGLEGSGSARHLPRVRLVGGGGTNISLSHDRQ
jgi:hypothetical protein